MDRPYVEKLVTFTQGPGGMWQAWTWDFDVPRGQKAYRLLIPVPDELVAPVLVAEVEAVAEVKEE